MPAVEEMRGLLARVEAATGLGQEMDGDLAATLGLAPAGAPRMFGIGTNSAAAFAISEGHCWIAPAYTASLDAALALVERVLPGWEIDFETFGNGEKGRYGHVCVRGPKFDDYGTDYADSGGKSQPLPLALIAATLRALIAQEAGR